MRDFRPKTKFNITINDFKTLLPTKWLSDNIIDFYLVLLIQNNHNLYAFDTKFYISLSMNRNISEILLNNVKNPIITKLLFPMNNSMHWYLILFDRAKNYYFL